MVKRQKKKKKDSWTQTLRRMIQGVPIVAQGIKNPTQCLQGHGFDPWPRSGGFTCVPSSVSKHMVPGLAHVSRGRALGTEKGAHAGSRDPGAPAPLPTASLPFQVSRQVRMPRGVHSPLIPAPGSCALPPQIHPPLHVGTWSHALSRAHHGAPQPTPLSGLTGQPPVA